MNKNKMKIRASVLLRIALLFLCALLMAAACTFALCYKYVMNSVETGAGEIAEALNVTPAALSYHLKLLKSADLIMEYKQKNFIYYEINTSVFEELILWIEQFGGNRK